VEVAERREREEWGKRENRQKGRGIIYLFKKKNL
jgi:hypothetical protein